MRVSGLLIAHQQGRRVRDPEGRVAGPGMRRSEARMNGEVKSLGSLARGQARFDARSSDIWVLGTRTSLA